MDEITNITSEALNRYFSSLETFGYMNYDLVNNLLVLSFIEEVLTDKFLFVLTEEDLGIISKALYCISGNCMIDFPVSNRVDELIHKIKYEFIPRLPIIKNILSTDIRTTEELEIRVKA